MSYLSNINLALVYLLGLEKTITYIVPSIFINENHDECDDKKEHCCNHKTSVKLQEKIDFSEQERLLQFMYS